MLSLVALSVVDVEGALQHEAAREVPLTQPATVCGVTYQGSLFVQEWRVKVGSRVRFRLQLKSKNLGVPVPFALVSFQIVKSTDSGHCSTGSVVTDAFGYAWVDVADVGVASVVQLNAQAGRLFEIARLGSSVESPVVYTWAQ